MRRLFILFILLLASMEVTMPNVEKDDVYVRPKTTPKGWGRAGAGKKAKDESVALVAPPVVPGLSTQAQINELKQNPMTYLNAPGAGMGSYGTSVRAAEQHIARDDAVSPMLQATMKKVLGVPTRVRTGEAGGEVIQNPTGEPTPTGTFFGGAPVEEPAPGPDLPQSYIPWWMRNANTQLPERPTGTFFSGGMPRTSAVPDRGNVRPSSGGGGGGGGSGGFSTQYSGWGGGGGAYDDWNAFINYIMGLNSWNAAG
jgi:hypothetical protein